MAYEIELASRWNKMPNRKREAYRAVDEHDQAALLELTFAYMRRNGSKRNSLSPATVRLYTHAITDLLNYFDSQEEKISLLQVKTDDINSWVEQLTVATKTRPKPLSKGSSGTYLSSCRNLFRALVWAEVLEKDPTFDVKSESDPTPAHLRKKAIPDHILEQIFEGASEDPDEGTAKRDVLILHLGASMGLRAAEIVALNLEDIDFITNTVHIEHGKGGKKRQVEIASYVEVDLKSWLQFRRKLVAEGKVGTDNPALLVGFHPRRFGKRLSVRGLYSIVQGHLLRAGLRKEMHGVHALRRTAGTRLYRQSRDLHVVGNILGHASVNTTAIYAKMDTAISRSTLEAAGSPYKKNQQEN